MNDSEIKRLAVRKGIVTYRVGGILRIDFGYHKGELATKENIQRLQDMPDFDPHNTAAPTGQVLNLEDMTTEQRDALILKMTKQPVAEAVEAVA